MGPGRSLSARRAWIEIDVVSVQYRCKRVALRKESVDRNFHQPRNVVNTAVALRKESVDRNTVGFCKFQEKIKSLSARRAWIEIKYVVKDSDFSGSRSPQGERG